jgi:hypothetical protein
MKYYMCYLQCERVPKNNLEKDVLKVLRDKDRKLIEYDEVAKFEHSLKVEVEQINRNNNRSKPVQVSLWKPMKDYFLQGLDCAIFLLLECEV